MKKLKPSRGSIKLEYAQAQLAIAINCLKYLDNSTTDKALEKIKKLEKEKNAKLEKTY